jgi:hypothetical protein
MYERANFFSRRFINNAVSGLIWCVMLCFLNMNSSLFIKPLLILFPVISFYWLYLGLSIRKKLKLINRAEEPANEEIRTERVPYKTAQFILTYLLFISLFLSVSHYSYAQSVVLPVVAIYVIWLGRHVRMIKKYLGGL